MESRITIYNSDCNDKLIEICNDADTWRKNRAVLFLDPYATEVKWATLEAIAGTQAIDLWYLFPFSAAQRMLPNKGVVESWRNKLNDLFGDSDWETRFYNPNPKAYGLAKKVAEDHILKKGVMK
jgi:three-Cys-motif partner protein